MQCRVCDSSDLALILDLGNQPWCNHFLKPEEIGKEPIYPLRLVFCHRCATPQLDYTVKKEVMFGDHTYLSGMTRTLSDHFRSVAQEVDRLFANQSTPGSPRGSVLDIGSNDGTQLRHFAELGFEVLGVESSKRIAQAANDAGIATVNEFFNLPLARSLGRKFSVINAAGVFFHLEELHSVTEGIRECLEPDGTFVVQFLYMKRIVENVAFDQIYHEHLLYYNLQNIQTLLTQHGLELFDAYLAPIHGGSIVAFATHKGTRLPTSRLEALRRAESAVGANEHETYTRFAARTERLKQRDVAYLSHARRQGKRIFGMGAPVKGNTLLNFFGIGRETLDCLVEKNPLRRGLYSPGMHIPVILEDEMTQMPDIYYVLAWNFRDEILARNRALLQQGVEFYFPIDTTACAKAG